MTSHRPASLRMLQLEGCSAPIWLEKAAEIEAGLARCLKGWGAVAPLSDHERPLAAVLRRAKRYIVSSRFTDRPTGAIPLTSAICSLIADLSLDWAETAPDVIGLHAGAVEVAQRLLVVAGPARAGKSTLVAALSERHDCRFFCDDVLALRADPAQARPAGASGVALGIAPRLRLPPADPALQNAMAQRGLTSDDRYGYFAPRQWAGHGETAPLGAFILLERREGAALAAYRMSHEDTVAAILRQTLTQFDSAEEALRRTSALLQGITGVRLVYSDLNAAADYLHAHAADLYDAPDLPPDLESRQAPAQAQLAPAAPDQVFEHAPEALQRRIGQRSWLHLPDDGMLWELNATSAAIWSMLELPGSCQDLLPVLEELYPEIAPADLLQDMQHCLSQMAEAGLLHPVA